MKTIFLHKSSFRSKLWGSTLFFFLSLNATAQFQIIEMLFNGERATTVNLTILAPNERPFTGPVPFDTQKIYNSGTTFKTPEGTSIALLCKGQMQVMRPNSTLKLSFIKNGIKAETLTGVVQHVLKDIKNNLSFYKAGNGYAWAHAEGTIFEVQAFEKSKKAKFTTQEGTISIIEEVPVTIAEKPKKEINRSEKAGERQLTTSKKTLNSAGDVYITNEVPAIGYETFKDALNSLDDGIYSRDNNVDLGNPDYALIEELAGNFSLLGGLYLENDQPDMAIDPLRKATDYYELTDPEGFLTLESYLYLAEALILSKDENNKTEGKMSAKEIVRTLEKILYENVDDLGYAVKNGDHDLVWDIKDDLVTICDYLGWAYDLLDETGTANEYYQFAEEYSND
ncbi:hypothetical protein EI546_12775 [Aequorivita sp. H23M31]|uniref:FecR protein domain-containing protein n=1 Tax=Aequorivita ciconiae TaxID=2494375 RepID=A0A410G5H1_9FLAO|nr:hypothetical protein [Aequorivita sp. H23M31]QAA82538.1 hypothetical protein EI546_12775 [Aequorivita sp. H23M31]